MAATKKRTPQAESIPSSTPAPSTPAPASASSALLPPHVIREIAVKSRRHEKTIKRYLRGEPVRPIVAADVSAAMTELGIVTERAAS